MKENGENPQETLQQHQRETFKVADRFLKSSALLGVAGFVLLKALEVPCSDHSLAIIFAILMVPVASFIGFLGWIAMSIAAVDAEKLMAALLGYSSNRRFSEWFGKVYAILSAAFIGGVILSLHSKIPSLVSCLT